MCAQLCRFFNIYTQETLTGPSTTQPWEINPGTWKAYPSMLRPRQGSEGGTPSTVTARDLLEVLGLGNHRFPARSSSLGKRPPLGPLLSILARRYCRRFIFRILRTDCLPPDCSKLQNAPRSLVCGRSQIVSSVIDPLRAPASNTGFIYLYLAARHGREEDL